MEAVDKPKSDSLTSKMVPKDETIMHDLHSQLKSAKLSLPQLSTIAQKGDEALVERFLSENVSVEGDSSTIQSQLYVAAFWGFYDVVKKLLDRGVDVNCQNSGTLWTPLHAATFQEHGKIVMILLERGSLPELQDSEGRTPRDFASASDIVWPHFAYAGCQRATKAELIAKGIIKKVDKNSSDSPSLPPKNRFSSPVGDRMAAYSRPDSAYAIRKDPFQKKKKSTMNDSSQMAALLGGDVLANTSSDETSTTNNEQPHFAAWRS